MLPTGPPESFSIVIDLKQRIAEMDATGVAVQAISLTTPMNYWGDAEISLTLAKT